MNFAKIIDFAWYSLNVYQDTKRLLGHVRALIEVIYRPT